MASSKERSTRLILARVAAGLVLLVGAIIGPVGTAMGLPDAWITGYEAQPYRWYGVTGRTWVDPAVQLDTFKTVRSVYADGWGPGGVPAEFNYIEAGYVRYHDDYAQRFVAYENFPSTPDDHNYQVRVYGQLAPFSTWQTMEINNHTIGGSNWYAAVGGQTLLHGLVLWGWQTGSYPNPDLSIQAKVRSGAERWFNASYPGTNNQATFQVLKKKDSSGTWSYWAAWGNTDLDPLWKPVKVAEYHWYTTPQ